MMLVCDLSEGIYRDGLKVGRKEGRKEGREEERKNTLREKQQEPYDAGTGI